MRKIFVTGNIGSGKTTLCRKLSTRLNIPTYHFDQIVWLPGWKRRSQKQRDTITQQLLNREEWIIDGVSVSDLLMDPADTFIFLDFPRWICFWRMIKRNIQCRFKSRPEMPVDCHDYRNIFLIIRAIWSFPRKHNPWVLAAMEKMKAEKHIIHIRNNHELNIFLGSILSTGSNTSDK